MWAFRTRPEEHTEQQQKELQELFARIPDLESIYWFRWGITEVFDQSADREEAAQRLEEYRELLPGHTYEAELSKFFATYDAHRDGILAYFDERKTSGPVEGINNKARVITKRCYGVKCVSTIWRRLCLDLNLARQLVVRTVPRMKELAHRIREKFLRFYT